MAELSNAEIPRSRRYEREWINIGIRDNDYDSDESIAEYVDQTFQELHPTTFKPRRTEQEIIAMQSAALEKLKRSAKEYEEVKRGSHRFSHISSHSHVSKVSGLPIEWYTFRLGGVSVGFDLEMWWRRSGTRLRINVLLIVLLLLIFLGHVTMAVIFISFYYTETIDSPYVCKTETCLHASKYLELTMDTRVDPCDNFFEFMCGTFKEDEDDTGVQMFRDLLSLPGYKLEMGEPSLLSNILKDFRHNPTYDQSIRYYQSCLNEENKKNKGIATLLDKIEYIFGTRDFMAFNTATKPDMTEIAIRLYKVSGSAYFMNMAFSVYPYIQLIRPTDRLSKYLHYDSQNNNKLFVERVFNYMMPQLGLQPDSPEIKEMVQAIGVFGFIFSQIYDNIKEINFALPNTDKKYEESLKTTLDGYCAPMNVKLDYQKVLNGFIQSEEWREEYLDFTTMKYWEGMKWCFGDKNLNKFQFAKHNLTSSRSRLSFVSLWLYLLFHDTLTVMDNDFIMRFTNEDAETWKTIPTASDIYFFQRFVNVEYKCLDELWKALGYLPSLRYLAANVKDPVDYIHSNIEEINELYKITQKLYFRIPKNEIHPFLALQGRHIFSRELQAKILMPLVGGIMDTFPDYLEFTDSHLHNYYVANNLTIESGRLYWLASTDRLLAPKWWGFGGPQKMKDALLDLRSSFVYPARYDDSKDDAFISGLFAMYLGREDLNYILFPLTLYNEPHIGDTLALKSSTITYKIIRTLLALVDVTTNAINYPYFNDVDNEKNPAKHLKRRSEMRKDGNKVYNDHPLTNVTCRSLVIPRKAIDNTPHLYKYGMETIPIQTMSSNDYEEMNNLFMDTMALKFAFKYFKDERKKILKLNYSSTLTEEQRRFRIQRNLPGKMEKFSEEQLFFMSFVRHHCVQSWKKAYDTTKYQRYDLEVSILNLLINSEEFRNVWNCKGNKLMNNKGEPKCFKWVP